MKKTYFHLLHLLIIIACWTSPFYLPWYVILVLILAYYFQNLFLGGCVISKMQFGTNEETMYSFFLSKLHIQFNKKILRFVTDHIFPWIILLIALIHQKIIK